METGSWFYALVFGLVAGLLLLSRAPFLLVVAAMLVLVLVRVHADRRIIVGITLLIGLTVVMTPWIVRNWFAYGEIVPFTTEGGKIAFQGTYLPGDDVEFDTIRLLEEVRLLEAAEKGLAEIETYRYWRSLAIRQTLADPLGQVILLVRKFIRFWVYLPQHSWTPAAKTGIVAAICLPLMAVACWFDRKKLLVQLAAVCVIGLWMFHGLVHSELRYNFPVLPLAFLLATLGAMHLLRRGSAFRHLFARNPKSTP
jgi:4-amino-4-deoxy-L-arabinose transferase-like glycosyltransferase